MENSEIGGKSKEMMAPSKPPSCPISSFQVLQKPINGGAAGTSSSSFQRPNENNKVENPPTRDAVSGAAFVFSATRLAEQFEKADTDPNLEQETLAPKIKRIMSNRLSARRSRNKKKTNLANLETQEKAFKEQIVQLKPLEALYIDQRQALMVEEHKLHQEIDFLRRQDLLRDAEMEKNKDKLNRLRELKATQLEQLQARFLNLNIGPQEPVSNYPFSNYYTNPFQVAGSGVGSSYMPPEQSQMQLPAVPNSAVPNFHETNLSLPYMGSVDPNMHEMNLSLPNYMGSMDHANETAPNYDPKP